MSNLSLDSIRRAHSVINPIFTRTPFFEAEAMSDFLGFRVMLKIETLNPIRCFKGRGADYFLANTDERGPFVCVSAGNFAQGLAFAARERGRSVIAFTPANAPEVKLKRLRALGTDVRAVGSDYDDARAKAEAFAAQESLPFVLDGRDIAISEGAATIGVEIAESGIDIDAIIVPLGGGALLSGVARWMKHAAPHVEIIGAAPAGAPAMALSWRERKAIETESSNTRADGLAIRVPIAEVIPELVENVDDILLFDDGYLPVGSELVRGDTSLMTEPSGAAAIATLVQHRGRFANRRVAAIITGANV